MKFLTSFFVAALCVSTCGIAQTLSGSQSSTDAVTASSTGATYVGSMMVTATIPSPTTSATSSTSTNTSSGTLDASKPTKGTRTTYEIFIFRSGSGQYGYSLNVSSIRIDDADNVIDGISTPDLFNFMGREAVRQGVALGYTTCSGTCGETIQGNVSSEYNIKRTGSGSDTRFYPVDTQTLTIRGYNACKESGSVSPTVSLVKTATTMTASTGTIQ